MSDSQWCLIESDPAVFTELIRGFGVTGLQVEELLALTPDFFANLKPVHGLIFLFKWMDSDFSDGKAMTDPAALEQVFFARQVIQNACATQALINILMNIQHPDIKLGEMLEDFKNFTSCFESDLKGESLTNACQIRTVHNSFSRDQIFEFDNQDSKRDKKDKEAAYHFISFVPINGRVVELDGLKQVPFDLGAIPEGQDWTQVVSDHLQKRIAKYSEGEIHFNLMAVVGDRKMLYEKQIASLAGAQANSMEVMRLQQLISDEDAKRKRAQTDNIRRRHNFLPMIVEVLKALAAQGKLDECFQLAKQRTIDNSKKKKVAKQ